jgi:nicotinamide-nucleotide amidase
MSLPTEISQLAATLGSSLTNKKLSITTAESCTGGGISYALTDTPGSSAYIDRCFVTYSNSAKHELLNVEHAVLSSYGAVSEQTVIQMAKGAAMAANADIAIAVSGVAGPNGGSIDKPVGTVWVAIKALDSCFVKCCLFSGDRADIRRQVIEYTLEKTNDLIK